MKSFRAETPDRSKRQASGQVTQDSIAVGFGSVVVQQARGSVPGTWDNRSTSKELPASDARQRGISLRGPLNVGPELIKGFQSKQTRCAPLSAVESAESRVWDRAR